jgi:translation initiation factor IF-1
MINICEGDKVTVSWDKERIGKIHRIRMDMSNNPIFTVKYDNGDLVVARIFELILKKEMVAN